VRRLFEPVAGLGGICGWRCAAGGAVRGARSGSGHVRLRALVRNLLEFGELR